MFGDCIWDFFQKKFTLPNTYHMFQKPWRILICRGADNHHHSSYVPCQPGHLSPAENFERLDQSMQVMMDCLNKLASSKMSELQYAQPPRCATSNMHIVQTCKLANLQAPRCASSNMHNLQDARAPTCTTSNDKLKQAEKLTGWQWKHSVERTNQRALRWLMTT